MRKTWSFVVMSIALLLAAVPNYGDMGKRESSVRYLDQGWSPELRQQFYHTPQGTELIPYHWFLHLKQHDGALFKDDITARYGFIPDPTHPDGLPVGFTISPDGFLGLNCAACHTSQIRYQGKTIYIDGGASMQNNLAFMKTMFVSLGAILKDDNKFTRFAQEVGKANDQLKVEVAEFLKLQEKPLLEAKEKCQDPDKKSIYANPEYSVYPKDGWGFGRLDALGRGGNTLLTRRDPCALERADASEYS